MDTIALHHTSGWLPSAASLQSGCGCVLLLGMVAVLKVGHSSTQNTMKGVLHASILSLRLRACTWRTLAVVHQLILLMFECRPWSIRSTLCVRAFWHAACAQA